MEKSLQNHFTAVFTFKTAVNGHIYIAFYKKKIQIFFTAFLIEQPLQNTIENRCQWYFAAVVL
jgi:hypothetical protein